MPKAQQLVADTEELGVLDLMDPEIEYDPGDESEEATVEDSGRSSALMEIRQLGPRLTLIVNDSVSPGSYEDHSGDGVDLTVYSRDPDLIASLSETMDDRLDEEQTQDLSIPVLPKPRERLGLEAHRNALAGRPADSLQEYFIANMDTEECQEAPELAAVVLKARHDLHLLQPGDLDPGVVEAFREECLLGLLRAAPEGNTPKLRLEWRAALKALGELYS
ncbi:MAG: hypothetical protein ACI9VR_001737 [Cognaticolwellia sp.]|jgi:hypothetical protein